MSLLLIHGTVQTLCTAAELTLPATLIHCLTRREARGLLVCARHFPIQYVNYLQDVRIEQAEVLCGMISFLAVSTLFIFILVSSNI
jgi:hypothetical protein